MKKLLLFALSLAAFSVAESQPRFTYADIAEGRFTQKSVYGLRSTADGNHYTTLEKGSVYLHTFGNAKECTLVCDAATAGIDGKVADYTFSPDEKSVMFRLDSKPLYRRSFFSRYAVYDTVTKKVIPVSDSDSLRFALFSPQGDKVAFVLDNNIYINDLRKDFTYPVTDDGMWGKIINGMPDWVYEEEWAIGNALRWSPDGSKLAFLRSDESEVKEFSFVKYLTGTPYPEVFSYKYPKAGEKNSTVSLRVFNIADGRTAIVDTGAETDVYVPFFEWTPDGRLYYFLINRLQNELTVNVLEVDGSQRTIYAESSPKYIDNISSSMITFLSDSDRFLVNTERDGYSHIYLYSLSKGFVRPVTSGEWNVTEVVCATDKKIWYLSTEGSPLRREFYSIGIDGKRKQRLSTAPGTYRIVPSSGCKYYISYFSNASTPNTVTLHRGDGRLVDTLEANTALKSYIASVRLPVKEFFTFTAPDGTELNAYMIKPDGFDPSKRYPVLLTQYSGPGSQDVRDRWSIDWEDALVQQGYIVVDCDPRGTGFRSADFKKQTYGIMGRLETEDQIAFAKHIATLPYVDSSRIGVYGWSYGGFMALNCILKGADVFKMAIAVAPVTSWRYYNTIYTERVNGLPQTNAEGYDEPSPIGYAKNLKGKLLIMHGTADDNVHIQNTHAMVSELTKAGKQLDMMIYTDDNHSMVPYNRYNIRQKMVDYCVENL